MFDLNFKISILDDCSDAGSYKNISVDEHDTRYQEPLVKAEHLNLAGESYYARTDGGNVPYGEKIGGSLLAIWLRKTVAEKLVHVNDRLKDFNVELFIWDAYRPIACQQGLWDFFHAQAQKEMPHADMDEIKAYVLKYVSDPTRFNSADPTTWPTHSTGGAVDLTLRDLKTQKLLDMGTHFDDMSEVSHSDYFERKVLAGEADESDPPVQNRRLLHWAMAQEGFVNYPYEFWHFDWGDQMYINNGHDQGKDVPEKAWYGYIEPPKGD